jgi:predicted ATP-grasp superfamily ATP-dependent carboligase
MASEAVLITAVSGRALAGAARHAGYLPLVADCFGDDDTLELAGAHERLTTDPRCGILADELITALVRLSGQRAPIGVVYGTGFEDRPRLLDALAQRFCLLGNPGPAVDRCKDPMFLAQLCRANAIPHPPTSLTPPADPAGWLIKRRGGAGGTHIRPATDQPAIREGTYYQRWVTGTPVSALVLGNGRRMMVLGFNAQWPSATKAHPFRYGGAVRPATLRPEQAAALSTAIASIVRALGLVGLCSLDFLLEKGAFWLLEVNPRPGATLDIFAPASGSLFGLHVAAVRGELPVTPPRLAHAAAQAIVYADRAIACVPAIQWPDWSRDRQPASSAVAAGQPLCSVVASASTSAEAKALITRRIAHIRHCLEARSS